MVISSKNENNSFIDKYKMIHYFLRLLISYNESKDMNKKKI